MPTLTGTLADVTGAELDPAEIRSVSVRAPAERPSMTGGDVLIVSAPVDLARSGVLSVALEPGPAVLVVVTDASHDVYELHVTADMTLLSEALAESSPDRSWVESVMVQLRDEAVAAAGAAAEYRVQTGLDRVATGEDREQTGLDRKQTRLDRVATGEDRTQTGLDRVAAETARGDAVDAAGDVAAAVAQFDLDFAADMAQFAGIRDEMNLTATTVALDANRAETAANEFGLSVTSSTLAPGAAATVAVSGDGPAYSLAFGVPQGPKGDKGATGEVSQAQLDAALAGKAATSHTHPVTDLTATGTRSSSTYLRGDGTWATPTNTTYAVPTQTEIEAGTATTTRAISAATLKGAIQRWATGTYSTAISAIGQALNRAATADDARAAIGAGTSNLTIGTTASTAKVGNYVPTWAEVTSKPATFPPDTHSHTTAQVTGLDSALSGKAAVSHTHTAAEVGAEPAAWSGTQAQFDALGAKNPNRTYYIVD